MYLNMFFGMLLIGNSYHNYLKTLLKSGLLAHIWTYHQISYRNNSSIDKS